MTPEQIATLMEYAQEVDKSITDTRRMAGKSRHHGAPQCHHRPKPHHPSG